MDTTHIGGLRWVVMILVPVALLLLSFPSQAQEVQRVYEAQQLHEVMEGVGNNIDNAAPQSKPLAQQPVPATSTGSTHPATPLGIASIFVVTNTLDSGTPIGSLRDALNRAFAHAGPDTIRFNILGSGVQTIRPLTAFIESNGPLVIDGTTQPGFAGTPLIEIDGSLAPLGTNGLVIKGGNSIVKGLVINRFRRFAGGGNGMGIVLDLIGGNVITGNYIGTSADGQTSLPNQTAGVGIFGASGGNRIGGTTTEERNVISGNGNSGIMINSANSSGNIVLGNYIGTNAAGTSPLGNGFNGVFVSGPVNTIGGLDAGARNIISGNAWPGVYLFGPAALGNQVINNYIGTDISGTIAIPNEAGVLISNAPNNTIGGSTPDEGNIIAGNLLYGIDIRNAAATGNQVLFNYIGTNQDNQPNLGHLSYGVTINASVTTLSDNFIAFNYGMGVNVTGGSQNLITRNSIFSNTGLAIDLAPAGLTINDPLDADAGPNNLQNFPILDSSRVAADGGELIVHGRLKSTPNAQFTIHFYTNFDYDPSHFGEGEAPEVSVQAMTDGNGNADFVGSIAIVIGNTPPYITATATDAQNNTSEFSQALCTLDSDGDGILDSWETQGWGIDVNSDGTIDLDLHLKGARPDHKDIFVEIDAMTGMAPQPGTLERIVNAFDLVASSLVNNPDGTKGIKLHCLPMDETSLTPSAWPLNWWELFQLVKQSHFGTVAEQADSNILEAKKLVYRYCIFAFTKGEGDASGTSENSEGGNGKALGGNDFMITMGTFDQPGGTEDQKAATFMHELGHTLGLRHGGGDYINYKPNYISIMNYSWQFKYLWNPSFWWGLNYSTASLPTLDESSLDEHDGINPEPSGPIYALTVPFSDPGRTAQYTFLTPTIPVDWNGDGVFNNGTVSVDLNIFKPEETPRVQTLTSQSDWDKLIYNFRNSPAFTVTQPSRNELLADSLEEEEMTEATFQFLNNLPPPKPYGQFVMDGQLDTSAQLIASNAGINLYAHYKSGQLYVATNSAQSQGADMFIFISDGRNSLRSAPTGKNGQVAAWSTFLGNESTDNSSEWFTTTETPLNDITVDTAGAVLEGVIYLELLFGKSPSELYIAVGKYGTDSGGTLIAQVPVGNGDDNIDPSELFWYIGAPPPLNTYFTQQGDKLVGTGAGNGPAGVLQGSSVDLSSDGNTAIVGGESDNLYQGATWIFTRSGNVWSQQGNKLVGVGGGGPSNQGSAVALSSDGNTAIVGGPYSSIGAAFVFIRAGTMWSQQGGPLVGTGWVSQPRQGCSVDLSSDGNTAIIGGFYDNSGKGAAWVFTRSDSGVWTQQGNKLIGTGAVGNGYQGNSVSLSSDGNTALIGAPWDNSFAGAIWVFTRTAGVWSQQGSKLVGTGAVGSAYQGSSVSLSSDGNTAMIGGFYDNSGEGATWVFTRTGTVWSQQGNKLVGTGAVNNPSATQGTSVSLSSDGNTALVGGFRDNTNVGAIWAFTRSGGVWSQQGNKLVGTGAVNTPYPALQGYSVSLSGDGLTAIVGGPNDATNLGAAWMFTHEAPLPIQLGSFTATIVNGSNVRLDWMTLSEINNYGFEVQRSPENENAYNTLPNSFIPGHGTTNEPQHYSFTDINVLPGQWYYRLKQIDLDGTVHYSDGVTINTLTGVSGSQLPDKFGLSQNYPDPFNPSTTIQYLLPQAAQVTLKIYNVLGQEVATLIDGVEAPGYKSAVWHASNIASGVYFYRIVATSGQTTFVDVRKMLVMK